MGVSEVDVRRALELMEEAEAQSFARAALEGSPVKFVPNAGPQTEAYYSKADILLYGGSGGGGKSALILGLALNEHKRSLIMRRQYTDLSALIDEAIKFNGTRKGFNGSSPPSLKTHDSRFIEFGACASPGDEQSWQGRPHSLKAFDEVTQFLESQVKFIMGWNRSTDPDDAHCRTVFASNPPVDSSGDWIIGMFRPWLDVTHHNPAADGELRWYITDRNGDDAEVSDSSPIQDGFLPDGRPRMLIPKSRTFIRASLDDNPYLANTGYAATLDAMPEPYRSAIRDGNFMMARKDTDRQLIPTAWVKEAMNKWDDKIPDGVPMCALGVDPAGGGKDMTVLSPRYDGYFPRLIKIPGVNTPHPQDVASSAIRYRTSDATVVVDCDGGYGGGVVRHLEDNGIPVKPYRGSHASNQRTKDRLYPFANFRAQAYVRFKEALDPSQPGGSKIILPPDTDLLAELTSVRFKITNRGISLDSKDEIRKLLGRSPDSADAVVMAWSYGDTIASKPGGVWENAKTLPKVVMSYPNRRRNRS